MSFSESHEYTNEQVPELYQYEIGYNKQQNGKNFSDSVGLGKYNGTVKKNSVWVRHTFVYYAINDQKCNDEIKTLLYNGGSIYWLASRYTSKDAGKMRNIWNETCTKKHNRWKILC